MNILPGFSPMFSQAAMGVAETPPFDVLFSNHLETAADNNSYSFGSVAQDIGAATSYRYVVVAFRKTGDAISGDTVTIGSTVLANKILGEAGIALHWGLVPSSEGTTAIVTVAISDGDSSRMSASVWHCQAPDGLAVSASTSAYPGSSGSFSLSHLDGGFSLGYITGNGSVAVGLSGGLTEDFDEPIGEAAQNHSGARKTGHVGDGSDTVNYTINGFARYIAASFR